MRRRLPLVDVSRRRTERLVNLVICLLSSRRFLTASRIAELVAGYEHDVHNAAEHEAFQRRFERDKAELRELGIPLETGTASVFDTEPGYRIARHDYQLPEIRLEPAEAAAVGIAARLWRNAGLASAASSGLRKLRAGGLDVAPSTTLGIEPIVSDEPALDAVMGAVRKRQEISFGYQRLRDVEPHMRALQPWGVVSWRGRWYVVGHDLHRGALRCFRLSRIVGEVVLASSPAAFTPPPKLDLVSHVVGRTDNDPGQQETARVHIEPAAAAGLRRQAHKLEPQPDGSYVATLHYSERESFAASLASYGPQVLVLDPPDLRKAVIVQLERMKDSHGRK